MSHPKSCPSCGSAQVIKFPAGRKISVSGDRLCKSCGTLWSPPVPNGVAIFMLVTCSLLFLFSLAGVPAAIFSLIGIVGLIGSLVFAFVMLTGIIGSWRVISGKAGTLEIHSRDGREVLQRIREILMSDWNPGTPTDKLEAADKYDSYADDVYRILARSRSEDALVEYLYKIERTKLGVRGASRNRLREVADKLLDVDTRT